MQGEELWGRSAAENPTLSPFGKGGKGGFYRFSKD
jgi:hypothetical protein